MESAAPSPPKSPETPKISPQSFPVILNHSDNQWPFAPGYGSIDSPFGSRSSEISPDAIDRLLTPKRTSPRANVWVDAVICVGCAVVLLALVVSIVIEANS